MGRGGLVVSPGEADGLSGHRAEVGTSQCGAHLSAQQRKVSLCAHFTEEQTKTITVRG